MCANNNLSFDSFYKHCKDRPLSEIFSFMNISPKDSDFFNNPKNRLLYDKIDFLGVDTEDLPLVKYGQVYKGRYRCFNYIIAERFVNSDKKIIIEIELPQAQKSITEITDKPFKEDENTTLNNLMNYSYEVKFGKGLFETSLYLLVFTILFSLLTSVIIVSIMSFYSDFKTALSQFAVVFMYIFLFSFLPLFCVLILPNLGNKTVMQTQKDKTFKSERGITIKTDNTEVSKQIVTPAFMKNYYYLKKAFNLNDLTCYFKENKFIAVMPSVRPVFGIYDYNESFDSIVNYKDFYERINSIYALINYFQKYVINWIM